MYLLYLDDSGSVGNKTEDYLVLGGVSVFERQVHWIASRLEDLAATIYPPDPYAVEFHASAIFNGNGPPWNGMTKSKRRQVIKDVLNILLASEQRVHAFACAVHKDSYPNQDPMEIAFEQLCSRFDLQLKRLYHEDKDTQRGLIILDESSYETSMQKLARDFRSIGTTWDVLVNLADIPMFVDSRASRMVQLADHIAYAVFKRYERSDTSYFDIIASRFDADRGGKLHGLLHMHHLPTKCMCPACLSRKLA